jgi:hypothetical protein
MNAFTSKSKFTEPKEDSTVRSKGINLTHSLHSSLPLFFDLFNRKSSFHAMSGADTPIRSTTPQPLIRLKDNSPRVRLGKNNKELLPPPASKPKRLLDAISDEERNWTLKSMMRDPVVLKDRWNNVFTLERHLLSPALT